MDANSLINEITTKVTKLKVRNERLEKENEELRNSTFAYLKELETQTIELKALQLITQNNSKESRITERTLDKYILLVDKCIATIDVDLDK